jgi:hypothetical protein
MDALNALNSQACYTKLRVWKSLWHLPLKHYPVAKRFNAQLNMMMADAMKHSTSVIYLLLK